MNERTQFYIKQEADFGRMDPSVREMRVSQGFRLPGVIRSLFHGISIGVMLSVYTVIVVIVLDRLEAPLPYSVKHFIADTEYKITNIIYELRFSQNGWKMISPGKEAYADDSPTSNITPVPDSGPTVEILE